MIYLFSYYNYVNYNGYYVLSINYLNYIKFKLINLFNNKFYDNNDDFIKSYFYYNYDYQSLV